MAQKRGRASYSAALREIRGKYGLTHKQAVATYNVLKEKAGGKVPSATSIRNAPYGTRAAVRTAKARVTRAENQQAKAERAAAEKRSAAAAKAAATRAANKAAKQAAAEKRSAAAVKGARTRERNRAALERGLLPAGERVGVIRDIDQWEDLAFWEWIDAEWMDYHAGVEYEET